ncbi:DinB family protein [Ureibacillus manganicus]|uniref:Damage-inducible protein DinB n=1 Tax=Ureibacillus manganicus DSM 26584 TaxID=1384049 RepID=A0A0A3IJD9_9BACL|nr:DinB family protein [Ureibacillus manganicus]KGR74992.1 damage-inducible protein DinB [Ureibacillus manganicus DSM 26584]
METIQKMYEHLIWANKRILASLHNIDEEQQEVIRLFSHILFSEIVWMARLQGIDSSKLPIWADVNLDFCEQLVKKNEENIISYLLIATKDDLEKTIIYKNSKGNEYQNTIREILTHVCLHGHYHRGQINTKLRSLGAEPEMLDFIHYIRS